MTSELTRSAISKTKMTKEFFETKALFETGHGQFFVRGENVKTSSLYETRAIVFTMHAQKNQQYEENDAASFFLSKRRACFRDSEVAL